MNARRVATAALAPIFAAVALTGCGHGNNYPTAKRAMGKLLPAYVGALFEGSSATGQSFCSASVVTSPGRNLILTAAHCLSGRTATDIVFAPEFDDGKAPVGVWHVNTAYLDTRWQAKTPNPAADFAFLTLDPQNNGKATVEVQDKVGAETLVIKAVAGTLVTVVGYPEGVNPHPITCRHTATQTVSKGVTYPRFDCNGYVDGTSGGPWLTPLRSGQAGVVGIIGGLQNGGDSDATSYSPPFGREIEALYHTAIGAPA